MRRRFVRRPCGFTLVELLVVIGIIALLIGILLPVLNRAREKAQMVRCLSNLHQIGLGFFAYAADNKGRLPPMMIWYKPNLLRAPYSHYIGVPGVTGDIRQDLKKYVDYNLLQCPLCKRMELDPPPGSQNLPVLPGPTYIETSYCFYADWQYYPDNAYSDPNTTFHRFNHINGYFDYAPGTGAVLPAGTVPYQFDVLASDLDGDGTQVAPLNDWETSHPTHNSGEVYYNNSSLLLSRYGHSGGSPRAKMTRNVLYSDGAAISYADQTYNYGNSSQWIRVPLFENGPYWKAYTYLPRRGAR